MSNTVEEENICPTLGRSPQGAGRSSASKAMSLRPGHSPASGHGRAASAQPGPAAYGQGKTKFTQQILLITILATIIQSEMLTIIQREID